jgi:hypothetical protein
MATVALSGIITPTNVVTATSTTTLTNKTLTGAVMNGTLGATTPSTVVATTVKASTTMGVGGATPSASGSGITFPATQSASSDANTLDDYEEGTWTPVIDSSTAGTGRATTIASALYTKIGNIVYFQCYVTLTTLGSGGSGDLVILGLPFTAKSSTYYGPVTIGYALGLNSTLNSIGGYILTNSTTIQITGSASDSVSPLNAISFATYAKASMQLIVSGSYLTT